MFYCLFIALLESTLNFQHFQKKKKKKNELHSLRISEIIDSKRLCLPNCVKCPVSENPSGVNVLKKQPFYTMQFETFFRAFSSAFYL